LVSSEAAASTERQRAVVELEAFGQALALATEAACAAFRAREGWVDGVRAGLVALLELFDQDPELARYLVVDSAQAGEAVLARRGETLERLAGVLDDERAPARTYPPPLTALAVVSGVLGVLHARLSDPDPGVLVELAGPLMSFTVLPFLGARAARRELRSAGRSVSPVAEVSVDLVQGPGKRLSHHREIQVLGVLVGAPGLNSTQVGVRAGIEDRAHVSRLLARMVRLGLVENEPGAGARRGVKAWRLTGAGERLHAEVEREACTSTGALLGLPEEFAGRLDFWAVCVLRAVGEQPWLTGSELAARAGVEDAAQMSRLLGLLAGLGLVEGALEPHRRGAPKVWRITDRGRELGETIGTEAPERPRRSPSELMWQSGGRLSDPAVGALHAIAAESGLSNREIARQMGIADANSASQLLARLAARGLIENVRDGGRENAWALTAAGRELESAICRDPIPRVSRSVASDLLREVGGRLNHRVVSVLDAIAREPGLSNQEIAERVGVVSKAHTSQLLARLRRFGLIENQVLETTPFQANAWQLTATGRQLRTTIHRENQPLPRTSRNGQGIDPEVGRR
jgi:DNA-binding MarR family transcriptional regulator